MTTALATRAALATLAAGTVAVVLGLGILALVQALQDPLLRTVEVSAPAAGPSARIAGTERGRPYRVSLGPVCVTRPGTIRITDVRAVGRTGVEVTAFAARAAGPRASVRTVRAERGTLAAAGWRPADAQVVTGVCDDRGGTASTLAVQVRRTGAKSATTEAFLVDWAADDGSRGSLTYTFRLSLCSGPLSRC